MDGNMERRMLQPYMHRQRWQDPMGAYHREEVQSITGNLHRGSMVQKKEEPELLQDRVPMGERNLAGHAAQVRDVHNRTGRQVAIGMDRQKEEHRSGMESNTDPESDCQPTRI